MKKILLAVLMIFIIVQSNTVVQPPKAEGHRTPLPICNKIHHDCGGCAWPEYRHDNLNTGFISSECAPPCDDVELIWEKRLSIHEHILNPPVIDCGFAFVGTTAGTFYA